jgi:nucleotide-binding universal stress UspA family protein
MQISGRIRSEGGGKPGETIIRLAEEESATMIVMGTRGLGKMRRTIMGSVSDFVVHHAHCPVIVCRQ